MNTLLPGKDRTNFDTVKIYPIPKNNIYKVVFLCIQMNMSHIILITKDMADMMHIAELQDTTIIVILVTLMDGGLGEGASSHSFHSSSRSFSFGKMLWNMK